jgi:hypothetical protein
VVKERSAQEVREALSEELAARHQPPEQPAELVTIYIELPDKAGSGNFPTSEDSTILRAPPATAQI